MIGWVRHSFLVIFIALLGFLFFVCVCHGRSLGFSFSLTLESYVKSLKGFQN